MRSLGRALVVAALVVLSGSWAWGAVTLSWTDANGPHTVNLVNIDNPMYDPTDPYTLEEPYVWFGVCNVAMSSFPIQFNVSGNFIGELGMVWPQVRIEQHVTNLTGASWNEFWIEIVKEDGEIYTKALIEQEWNFHNELLWVKMWTQNPVYYIGPNQIFDDTLHYWAMISNPSQGNGTLTFTKRPVLIPEPGSAAAFLSGLAGLVCYRKKRRE